MSLSLLSLAVSLKLPLVLLAVCVWWAIRKEPGEARPSDDEDGGGARREHGRRPPFKPPPRRPRRGPHGDPAPPAPARIRTVAVRARAYGH